MMSMIAAAPVEAPARVRIAWTELTCLTCGEVAGYIENQRIVRPVTPGRVRIKGRRLGCGRCGGLLLPGERGISTSQAGIG
jgi:RNase P subunit RPR2